MARASNEAYLYFEGIDKETESLFDVGKHNNGKTPKCVIRRIDYGDPNIYLRVDRSDYGSNHCFLIPVAEIVNCQSGRVNENLSSRRYPLGNIKLIVDDGRKDDRIIEINISKEDVEALNELNDYWNGELGG